LTTSLMSAYWTRTETLSRRKLSGILLGVAGTVLLFWPREHLGFDQALSMLATLAGSLFASVNLVTMKKYGKHTDTFVLNFFGMAIGAACQLLTSAGLERWSGVAWTRSNVLALLYLSIFGSVFAFLAYYALIKRIDATIVSLTTLIIPIVALALGRAILDEIVSPMAVAGIATILAGVTIAVVPAGIQSRRQAVPSSHRYAADGILTRSEEKGRGIHL